MNLEQARTNMVEQQIRTWEVLDQEVLDLLYVIPREEFVPQQHRALAFSDLELPLEEGTKAGEGERMWQPKLEGHGTDNIVLEIGDAARGWARRAPYDAIVLTGSTPILPQAFLDQLAPGGRLFAVVGEAPAMQARLVTSTAPGASSSVDLFETVLRPLANAEQPRRFRF